MSVTVRQVEVFLAVVEQGGFSAAADHLRMSQSAVSHTVAALEREVGDQLVHRAPPSSATALGQELVPHARAVQSATRALEARIALHRTGATSGTVRLAVAPTAAHRLVPRLLRQWRTRLPDVRVTLFEGGDDELADWLDSGVVDAAVLIDPEHVRPGAVVLAQDDFRAVVRSDHPLASEPVIALTDLLEDPLLVSSSGCEPQIKGLHTRVGAPYRPAQRVHSIGTLLGMVDAGLGVAVMPSLASSMIGPELVMVGLEPYLSRTLVLTGPAGRPWSPALRQMCDVAALFSSDDADA
ncbi:LysR family transcriptional regulator [Streptomyces sp. CRN 30]|uniref:LysR family transcriptional regulator n=1 Tax=Streptomyces sp. CRN 30 TaxID=3075613 RepID=UPI002A808943|nr:LysR family transcriptional regulator [Streptomyces sp. CRN 30]